MREVVGKSLPEIYAIRTRNRTLPPEGVRRKMARMASGVGKSLPESRRLRLRRPAKPAIRRGVGANAEAVPCGKTA